MRLDARKGDHNWHVWHVERCCKVRYCVWVDDETNEYCTYNTPLKVVVWELGQTIHHARRIAIYPDRRLVLINPIADEEPAALVTRHSSPVTAA